MNKNKMNLINFSSKKPEMNRVCNLFYMLAKQTRCHIFYIFVDLLRWSLRNPVSINQCYRLRIQDSVTEIKKFSWYLLNKMEAKIF